MYSYIASAQRATSVTHSCTGNFTSPEHTNLIVCKATSIEVSLLTPEGTSEQFSLNLYGRVASCQLYRPASESKDLLFVLTERCQFFVLSYDSEAGQVVTKATGNVNDNTGRQNENKKIGIVDPKCRLVGLHLYQGLLKVIPIDSRGSMKDAFNVRLEEIRVVDMAFLYGYTNPTLCLLYEDNKDCRHIKTYEVDVKTKDLAEGPWSQPNVDPDTNMLIPIPQPFGGVLILGLESISYHSGKTGQSKSGQPNTLTIPVHFGEVSSFCKVDDNGSRWLIGDEWGGLHVIVLQQPANTPTEVGAVSDISLEFLGETSIASSLDYLDNGYVFVGSSFGDSQLIHLSPTKNPATDSYVSIIQNTTSNLGPISDLCVVDLDRQGQCQVVTCSGAYKDGTLRVVRNGIGIDELASVDLCGVKGMWNLRKGFADEFDTFLVQSFITETRVLTFQDNELGETEIEGMAQDCETLLVANLKDDLCVQATRNEIRLIDSASLRCISTWSPSSTESGMAEPTSITVACCSQTEVVVALSGGEVLLLKVSDRQITESNRIKMQFEVCCMSCNDTGDLVAIGLWTDVSVRLVSLKDLSECHVEKLNGETMARSLLFATFESTSYLLVGLGDGVLNTFKLASNDENKYMLKDKKKVSLGTKPIRLCSFVTKGIKNVFAACDRPTVIYSSSSKLMFSNVNLGDTPVMSPFNSRGFPESLALASKDQLSIGTINEIQKLHIRTIQLNERPDRICHQPAKRVFIVGTTRSGPQNAESAMNISRPDDNAVGQTNPAQDDHLPNYESSYVRIIDDQTFEVLDSFELDEFECCLAVTLCKFEKAPEEFIVVGTTYCIEGESEPTRGRVLVFSITETESTTSSERKLTLVTERVTRGAVYCLNSFNGKLLAGVHSKVQLFSLMPKGQSTFELQSEASNSRHIMVLFIQSKGEFILVGDLVKSVILLSYNSVDGTIEEIARDYNGKWMTAIEMFDTETFIGAEHRGNIFTAMKNNDALTDEASKTLNIVGKFHLGDFVNKFCHGSLVMNTAKSDDNEEDDFAVTPTLLFGTVDGILGIVAPLSKQQYNILDRLQTALNEVIVGVGGLKHSEWRSYLNDRKVEEEERSGIIDGDLIEVFLDLNATDMEKVAAAYNKNAKTPTDETQMDTSEDAPATSKLLSKPMEVDSTTKVLSVKDITKIVEDLQRTH